MDDNKWCPGGVLEYVPGVVMPVPGGLEGIAEACPGGMEQNTGWSRGVE